MPQDPGPMVRRRQLGAALRRYRTSRHLSIKQVAEQLLCSEAKISRIETAQRNATLRDVRDLSNMYDLPEAVKTVLMDLARGSRERGWWQDKNLDAAMETLIGMEGSADSISEFECLIIPGLLQTNEYANAILEVWEPTQQQKSVDIRIRRQRIFYESSRPAFNIIMDEAAIRRSVGSTSIMRRQIERLIEAANTVARIQIIPFSAGAHLGMTNGFTILQFPQIPALAEGAEEQSIQAVVYAETLSGGTYYDDTPDVERHIAAFADLRTRALSPEQSINFLRNAVG